MSSEIEPSLRDTAWQYIPTEPLNADFDHRHGLHVVTQDTQPAPELQDDANSLPAWDVAKFAELDIDLTPQDLTVLEWLASANGERTSPWMIRRFMRTKHPALTETAAGQAVRKSIRNINQSPTLPVEIRHDGNAALRQYWLANKPEQQADTVIPNLSFVRTKSSASFFVDGKELQLSPVAETVATLILDTSEHEVEYAELRRALQNNRNRMFSIREFDLILKDLDRVLARADVFFNEPRVIPEKGQYRFVGLRAVEVARPTAAVVAKTKVSTPTSAQQPAKPARVPGSPRVRRVHTSNVFKNMDPTEYDRHVGCTVLRVLNANIDTPMSASLVHQTLLNSENPLDKLKMDDIKKFLASLSMNDNLADSFEVTGEKRLTFTLTEPIDPEEAVPMRYELSDKANALLELMKRFPQGVPLRSLYAAYNQNLQQPVGKDDFKEFIREIQVVTKGKLRTTIVGRDSAQPITFVRLFSDAEMAELRQRQLGVS